MEIKHVLNIKATPETIYDAVSTENGIKGWWSADCSVGTTEGSSSLLKFDKQGMLVAMGFITLTLQTNEKVVWECISMPNPAWIGTKISTAISPGEDGCQVIFTHSNFDKKWAGLEPFEQTKGTWNHFVSSLVSFCEGGTGQPW
jgi:uncharacterized protein YndB with AHSA1/START domain